MVSTCDVSGQPLRWAFICVDSEQLVCALSLRVGTSAVCTAEVPQQCFHREIHIIVQMDLPPD